MVENEIETVPLFPLNTVLFPYGNLSLRIFEPRYLSMVSEQMKSGRPFGVVLIKSGQEAGEAASFHTIGTLSKIIDFDQLEDGMLGLTCEGTEKFKVVDHHVRPDQLIIGQINRHRSDQQIPDSVDLMDAYQNITDFLQKTLEKEELKSYRESREEDWTNPTWISYQLTELLPLSGDSRQLFLEMSTRERLSELTHVLSENELL